MSVTNLTVWDFRHASWGSIIGGVLTVFAVSILLATLGTALGFEMIDPKDAEPLAGFGITFGIWSAVILLVSLAAGGFIAGRLAGRNGFAHGFLVWAATLICASVLGGMAVSSIIQTAGNAVGSVASTAGVAIEKGVSSFAPDLESLTFNFDPSVAADPARNRVNRLLRATEVDVLQPAYLQRQMRGASVDARRAMQQLSTSPNNYESVLTGLIDRLKQRVDSMSQQTIDRNAAIAAVVRNTNMPQEQAASAVDDLIMGYNQAVRTSQASLEEAQQQINDLQANMVELERQAREQADAAASAIATSALIAFFAMLIGALVCAFAGRFGSRYLTKEEEETITTVL